MLALACVVRPLGKIPKAAKNKVWPNDVIFYVLFLSLNSVEKTSRDVLLRVPPNNDVHLQRRHLCELKRTTKPLHSDWKQVETANLSRDDKPSCVAVPITPCHPFLCPLSLFALQLAGAAILAVGVWVKVDSNSLLGLLESVEDAPAGISQLANVTYMLIAMGVVLLVLGFLGCCGAVKESRCMLLTVSHAPREVWPVNYFWAWESWPLDVSSVLITNQ